MRVNHVLLACALLGQAASASVVLNPVAAPVAPGVSAALQPWAKAPAIAPTATKAARIQSLQSAGDGSGRLFIVDTAGLVEVAGQAGGTPATWLDLRGRLPGFTTAPDDTQTGLTGLAFHPNFAGDPNEPGYGTFYVMATTTASAGAADYAGKGAGVSHHDVLMEYKVADPAAATASITASREVLRVAQPERDHGPGTIAFNPTAAPGSADYGKLYVGLGDGGGVGDPNGNAQDLGSPFGKILRIDPADPDGPGGASYAIPADNPFAGQSGKLGEVWAYGLRNPQQFSWDADTGRMLVIDIGQAQLEEVNVGTAGANYGWPAREGTFARGASADPNVYDSPANSGAFLDPVAQFDHEEFERLGFALSAISGVFAYHGSLLPELDGMAVLSELVSGRLFYFPLADIGAGIPATLSELQLTLDGLPASLWSIENGRVDLRLGQDGAGELYLLSKARGDIFRLVAATVPETATWVQVILGFGLLGAALRGRRLAVP